MASTSQSFFWTTLPFTSISQTFFLPLSHLITKGQCLRMPKMLGPWTFEVKQNHVEILNICLCFYRRRAATQDASRVVSEGGVQIHPKHGSSGGTNKTFEIRFLLHCLFQGGEKKGVAKGLRTVVSERYGPEAAEGCTFSLLISDTFSFLAIIRR